jgi:von Willebrand factor type A domain-containing protein
MAMIKMTVALALAASTVPGSIPAKVPAKTPCVGAAGLAAAEPARVQLALLLDTSNSMDGLIDQARSQLWTVVNEFAGARRNGRDVALEVALYEYGNDRLASRQGYLRQVLPFTADLDRVSEELFALTTSGGDEYCGTVIQAALDQLRWSASPADLKAVFIAGNEPFSQGPVDYRRVSARAQARGVLVNTIHCGTREFAAGERAGWQDGARRAYGVFGEFDQDQEVAQVAAPQDDEIARLGVALNGTYIPYGAQGFAGLARQQAQDGNASKANKGAVVNRAFAKSKHVYSNSTWDLVDAVKNGQVDVKTIRTADLPAELQRLSVEARKEAVAEKARERARLQARIQELEAERKRYLAQARRGEVETATLDTVMMEALRDQAACRGFALQ